MRFQFQTGLCYLNAHELQTKAAEKNLETLFGFELQRCITTGKRDPVPSIVKLDPRYEVVKTDRGGLTTMHHPGQLVIFPAINLRFRNLHVRDYVELLLTVTQKTLRHFDVQTARTDSPGLWTFSGKLAFVGIRIVNGWTQHGLAINVSNAIEDFSLINSCGLTSQRYASIQSLTGHELSCARVFNVWCDEFFLTTGFKSSINTVSNDSSLGAVGSAFP